MRLIPSSDILRHRSLTQSRCLSIADVPDPRSPRSDDFPGPRFRLPRLPTMTAARECSPSSDLPRPTKRPCSCFTTSSRVSLRARGRKPLRSKLRVIDAWYWQRSTHRREAEAGRCYPRRADPGRNLSGRDTILVETLVSASLCDSRNASLLWSLVLSISLSHSLSSKTASNKNTIPFPLFFNLGSNDYPAHPASYFTLLRLSISSLAKRKDCPPKMIFRFRSTPFSLRTDLTTMMMRRRASEDGTILKIWMGRGGNGRGVSNRSGSLSAVCGVTSS